MKKAYISLGANLGNEAENLRCAVTAIGMLPGTIVTTVSSIYETAPVGYRGQSAFFNMVIGVETELSPHALLGACLGIEAAMGRVRTCKNGPRIIDIDLLFYERISMEEPELILPHPRMAERAFVMIPLAEIAPQYASDAEKLDGSGVKKRMRF